MGAPTPTSLTSDVIPFRSHFITELELWPAFLAPGWGRPRHPRALVLLLKPPWIGTRSGSEDRSRWMVSHVQRRANPLKVACHRQLCVASFGAELPPGNLQQKSCRWRATFNGFARLWA